jgi:acyl-coenzyme A synthetase/AMP-(fatty) acid ligase
MKQDLEHLPKTALGMIIDALIDAKDRPIVERRGQWHTAREILNRVYARAMDLKSAGQQPSQTALIVVSDNFFAIEQLLACWLNGAAGAFVDFRTPPARVLQAFQQLDADIIIGMKPINGVSVHLQCANPILIDFPSGELQEYPDSVAIYASSSGTTGPPRFTQRTQSKLATRLAMATETRDWDGSGAALSALSVAYSASSFRWLWKLSEGGATVALDLVHRLSELNDSLKREDVSETGLAPSQIRRLLEIEDDADKTSSPRYPQLTHLRSIGGPANPKEKHAAVKRLSKSYQMTYSAVGVGVIARIIGDEIAHKPASVGRPVATLRVQIIDGDRECAVGEVGEVSISDNECNNSRPGDMGYFDEDGYLYITGRVQGLLCRNGVNFNSQRLVQAALQHATISNAEVVSKLDADQGDIVYLVIEGQKVQIKDVWREIRKNLPVSEQPDHIVTVDRIPTTASLKNDLVAVRALISESSHDG